MNAKKEKLKLVKWLMNTLQNNTMRCKRLAAVVSGQNYIIRLFLRQKQESGVQQNNSKTKCSGKIGFVRCRCFTALVLTFFRLTKGHPY